MNIKFGKTRWTSLLMILVMIVQISVPYSLALADEIPTTGDPGSTPIAVTGVSLNKSNVRLIMGGSEQLQAIIEPANATNSTLKWSSSNESIVRVSSDGTITPMAAGQAAITVMTVDGSFSAACLIEVYVPVTGVSLRDQLTISVGNNETLTATVMPSSAENKNVTWRSDNPSIAEVDSSGRVTGKVVGSTRITVTTEQGQFSASCNVTVGGTTGGIVWREASIQVSNGRSAWAYVSATTSDVDVTRLKFTSSNSSIASVSANRMVGRELEVQIKGAGAGQATVTATTPDGTKSAQCTVNVTQSVTEIRLSSENISVAINGTATISATAMPVSASNKNVVWSSDNNGIATVQNGIITGKSAGTVNIWAKSAEDNSISRKCVVNVIPPISSITLPSELSLTVGEVKQLSPVIYPSSAAGATLTWTSSNTAVATVDASGKVTGRVAGYSNITVTAGGQSRTCKVTVAPSTVLTTSLSLYPTSLSLANSQTATLTATLSPNNATNKNVSWLSSNTAVATVTPSYGTSSMVTVRAVGMGTATITATSADGGKTAICRVSVGNTATTVQALSFYPASVNVVQGGYVQLTPTVTPVGASGSYTWTSSRTDVATVTNTGNVRGVTAGTSYITVRDQNSGKSATCTVTVTASNVPVVVPVPGTTTGNAVTLPFTPVSSFENGKPVITARLDESSTMISISQRPGLTSAVVPVTSGSATVKTQVYYGVLSSLMGKNACLELRADYASYQLPAKAVNVASVAGQLGAPYSAVKYNITVDQLDQDQASVIKTTAAEQGLNMITTPVAFNLEGEYGYNTVEITELNGYVEKGIVLTGYVDANSVVGVQVNDDGTFTPVPTRVATSNGKTLAYVKSHGNGIFAVVRVQKSFTDATNHWAKNDINILASKLVVSGVNDNQFAPEKKVTRAEFATIIVRALGLQPNESQGRFIDVSPDDWYAGAIGAAVEAGIIKGYQDNSFKPNAYVTREEVAVMLVRAMKLAGVDTSIGVGENQQYLTRFSDGSRINTWAQDSIAIAVKLEIINGNSKGMFLPATNTTRAETVVTIKRMLTKANFI